MSKKLIYLISFVLSLGVAGNASAGNIAWNPFPADGAVCVDLDVVLSWSPGDCATSHKVYFGTEPTALAFLETVVDTSFDPGILTECTPYYWRIDEVCEETIFAVAPPDQVVVEPGYTIPGYTIVAVAPDEACLVAYWPLDTDFDDYSANGFNDGTPMGGASIITDPANERGQVLSLDGNGDYVNIDGYKGILGTNPFTVAAWIKKTATEDSSIVCWGKDADGQRADFQINNIRLRMEHGNGDVEGDTANVITDGEWHHVAVTVIEDARIQYPDVTIYLDGQNDTRTDTDPDRFNIVADTDVSIGRRPTRNDRYFNGMMDDVSVYNCALSHGEVRYLAGVGDLVVDPIVVPPIYGPLVAHYEFEGDASDSSGNNLHGTLMGHASIISDITGGLVLDLDGNGDYVDCGNDPLFNPAGSFSISVWFNMSSWGDSGGNVIVSKSGESGVVWQLCRYGNSDKLTFTTRGLSNEHLPSTIAPTLFEWHHIAAIYDGFKKVVYLDCEKDAEVMVSGTINASDHNVYIGARAKSDNTGPEASSFFNGMIDDVRIYNYALSYGEARYLGDCGDLVETEIWEGDVWSFTTEDCPCECLSIRVSQESSPDLGDFDENVLGCIKVFETADSAEDYYRYGDPNLVSFSNPDFINQHGLIADRSHLFLVCGCDGLSLFIVHGKPGPHDANSFTAEMRFELLGVPGGARRTVEDDPNARDSYDAYTPALGEWDTIFRSRHKWFDGRTDGQAITGLDGEGWSMLVEFTEYDSDSETPVIKGLSEWFAYSEDGPTIELALEERRRVRLDCCIPECDILEYKKDIKWSQPPARYEEDPIYIDGWDEISDYNRPLTPIIADDWRCKDDRPIKDIHWWGSFKGWTECVPPEDRPDAFHIGIWTDVPDPDPRDPNTFSHPNEMVWEKISGCYVWSFAGYDLDPRGIDQNDACFKFDQLLSQDEWFYQDPNDDDGTVYWLSISAIYEDGFEPNFPWGWKTRPHFYADDAVRIVTLDGGQWPPVVGSAWENGEPIQYPAGTSWDMAFVLTANRKYTPRKWRWPHESRTVREELMAVDIYEDGKIDFKDLAVSANYWLEEAVWP